jgi:hypothetical protein
LNDYNFIFNSIALIGYPKSGKTTFAKKLALQYKLSHLSLDAIVGTFEKVFPELRINHDIGSHTEITKAIAKFTYQWIEQQLYYQIPFVFEGYHIDIEEFNFNFSNKGVLTLGLGYSSISAEDKLNQTREYSQSPDWTLLHEDQKMLEWFDRIIPKIALFKEQCIESNIPYFDTSKNFWQTYSDIKDYLDNHLL